MSLSLYLIMALPSIFVTNLIKFQLVTSNITLLSTSINTIYFLTQSRQDKRKVLVGLVAASASTEQEVLDSMPGSGKVLLGFAIGNFLVVVTESGFVPV